MQSQIAVKPSVLHCHVVNTNEELGGLATAIPPFAKLLWSLLILCCLIVVHFVGSADDIAASSDDEDDDEDYDPDNDEYWKKVTIS